jgi:hypothetical protein
MGERVYFIEEHVNVLQKPQLLNYACKYAHAVSKEKEGQVWNHFGG